MYDLEAPGVPRRKQPIDVDFVGPADEVAFRLVLGRPVDGAAPGIDRSRQIVATLERRLTLLDG